MANEKQVLTNCQRLVDPGVLIRDLTAMKSMYDAIALDGIIKALKEAPTVDAEEVVRCKDCNEYDEETGKCYWWLHKMESDDFCSYGERREGE